jgi:hypothetical protein
MKSKTNNDSLPKNWENGFRNGDIRPACGGKEVPVFHPARGWTLLCWDYVEQRHLLYIFNTDTFEEDFS